MFFSETQCTYGSVEDEPLAVGRLRHGEGAERHGQHTVRPFVRHSVELPVQLAHRDRLGVDHRVLHLSIIAAARHQAPPPSPAWCCPLVGQFECIHTTVSYSCCLPLSRCEYMRLFRVAYSWPLCANTTSFVKPEVPNVSQRRHRKIYTHEQAWNGTFGKMARVVSETHTNRHDHHNSPLP